MMTHVTTLTPPVPTVFRGVPTWREVLMAVQTDNGVAKLALVCGTIVAVSIVAGLAVVAVVSGSAGVAALGTAIGALAGIGIKAWMGRKRAQADESGV